MSPEAENLHFAARRYCIERFVFWAERYRELAANKRDRQGSGYTSEAYRTFPRYQVLDAIRIDLERLTGSDVRNLADARETFALVGLTAENEFTSFDQPEARAAVQEEREAFERFVRNVSSADLREIEPLPYARVLSADESDRVWQSVERAWGLRRRQYWYPLAKTHRADVEAYQAPYFQAAMNTDRLGKLLAERGVTRVWELREYGPAYERDASAIEMEYNGAEGFWTSGALDWIIYASHESSITVGGWMLAEVRKLWPDSERHIWTTPYFN